MPRVNYPSNKDPENIVGYNVKDLTPKTDQNNQSLLASKAMQYSSHSQFNQTNQLNYINQLRQSSLETSMANVQHLPSPSTPSISIPSPQYYNSSSTVPTSSEVSPIVGQNQSFSQSQQQFPGSSIENGMYNHSFDSTLNSVPYFSTTSPTNKPQVHITHSLQYQKPPTSTPVPVMLPSLATQKAKDFKFILHTFEPQPQPQLGTLNLVPSNMYSMPPQMGYKMQPQSHTTSQSDTYPFTQAHPQMQLQTQQQPYNQLLPVQGMNNNITTITPIPGCMAYHHPLIPIIPSVKGNTKKHLEERDSEFVDNNGTIITSSEYNIRRIAFGTPIWTEEENKLLKKLKEEEKLGWRDIAMYFPGRTISACTFRWRRMVIKEENKKKRELRKNLIKEKLTKQDQLSAK